MVRLRLLSTKWRRIPFSFREESLLSSDGGLPITGAPNKELLSVEEPLASSYEGDPIVVKSKGVGKTGLRRSTSLVGPSVVKVVA